jgi:hypothetical protein
MKLSEFRSIIRKMILIEAGGATTIPSRPMGRNPMGPSMSDREQIGRISVKDKDEPDEIAGHLRDPLYDEEDCWGPVPPTSENPHVGPDIYTNDFNVIPTPPIKR